MALKSSLAISTEIPDVLDTDETLHSTPLSKTPTSATTLNSLPNVLQKAIGQLSLDTSSDEENDDDDDTDAATLNSISPADTSSNTSGFLTDEEDSSLLDAKLRSANSTQSLASPVETTLIPAHKRFGKLIHKHEIPRKVFHSSIGFLTLWLYTKGVDQSKVAPPLFTLLAILTATDFIRFRNEKVNKLYCQLAGPLMREKEVNEYNGVLWYLLGLGIVLSIFPKDISVLSVLLLSWADTAASTFGRAYGHLTPKFGNKSLAGSIASFFTGVISAILMYKCFIPVYGAQVNTPGDIMWTPETSNIQFPLLAFLIGLVGAISEAIDVFNIDDNFTIPVISAFFMWPVLYLGMKR